MVISAALYCDIDISPSSSLCTPPLVNHPTNMLTYSSRYHNQAPGTWYIFNTSVTLIQTNFPRSIIPMTMETRSSKVIFQKYSKKKPTEDTLVPPLWGTREKNVRFSSIICLLCCTRRNLRFHVENSQHADQKQLTRR